MNVKCVEKVSRTNLLVEVILLLLVVVLLTAATVVLIIIAARANFGSKTGQLTDQTIRPGGGTVEEPSWNSQSCVQSCGKPEYEDAHTPLVIISLNGFTKPLLEHRMDTLNKVAECGVTSESVIPCFPSETFTNKLAIATGLYPESQQFEPSTLAEGSNATILMPIWMAYKIQTRGKVAMHSWPIDNFQQDGRPDYYVTSNSSTSLREQLDQVVSWLGMPADSRPGLVMVSNDDMIVALQKQASKAELAGVTLQLDRDLNHFFTQLHQDGILRCVNVVFVSDRGLSKRLNRYDLDLNADLSRSIVELGVVARVFSNGTDTRELQRRFSRQPEDAVRVFTRFSAPPSWHYGGAQRAADLLVVGRAGTELCRNCGDSAGSAAVPGYDFHDPQTQSIFFAQGPSFRIGIREPPFQNIELMNLWLELLNLRYVPNNGSSAFPDQLLSRSSSRQNRRKYGIRECQFTNEDTVINCGGCSILQQARISKWMVSCPQPKRHLILLSSSSSTMCYQKFCEKLIITGTTEDESVALVEIFHQNNTIASSQTECRFVSTRYDLDCPAQTATEGQELRSLSANPRKVLAHIATIQTPWDVLFLKDVLDHLNAYTMALSKELGRVICITGTAYDRDLDGVADSNKTGPATHLYRVLIKCTSAWDADGFSCRNPLRTEVLAFIFPHMNGDANGLPSGELLLQYTARLRDVELISGIEFDLPSVPSTHMMHLKLHVATQLW